MKHIKLMLYKALGGLRSLLMILGVEVNITFHDGLAIEIILD